MIGNYITRKQKHEKEMQHFFKQTIPLKVQVQHTTYVLWEEAIQ